MTGQFDLSERARGWGLSMTRPRKRAVRSSHAKSAVPSIPRVPQPMPGSPPDDPVGRHQGEIGLDTREMAEKREEALRRIRQTPTPSKTQDSQ